MAPRPETESVAKNRRGASVEKAENTIEVRRFTWEEVAKHNTSTDLWVTVHEKVYDVTKWVDRHPGGKEVLQLVAGRDCTEIFESYHPFTQKAHESLTKYQIGVLRNGSYEFPPYQKDNGFYKELCERVNAHFVKNKIDPKASTPGLWRMFLVMVVAFSTNYCAFGPSALGFSFPVRVLFAAVFGICQAMPLLHVMHDCSHTSFGHTQTGWMFWGRLFMDFYAGCNMTSWHNQHTIGHHVYTNVFTADPDLPLEKPDVRRLVSRQAWTDICQWQYMYLPVLYGFLGITMRIADVQDVFGKNINGPVRVNPHGMRGHLEHFLSKSVCAFWRIYIPLFVFHTDVMTFCVLTLVAEMMTGYWLAFNFQVSHISDVADFPMSSKAEPRMPQSWAVAQVEASVDYSHNDTWTTFCCGALNYQTEHHLFPTVSQYQYPAIAPIVMEVCKKHNVRYNHLPDFYSAFYHHVKYLYNLGQKGVAVPLETRLG